MDSADISNFFNNPKLLEIFEEDSGMRCIYLKGQRFGPFKIVEVEDLKDTIKRDEIIKFVDFKCSDIFEKDSD